MLSHTTLIVWHFCRPPLVFRLLHPLLGRRQRRYGRSHISHMRLDRFLRLIHPIHGPSPASRFGPFNSRRYHPRGFPRHSSYGCHRGPFYGTRHYPPPRRVPLFGGGPSSHSSGMEHQDWLDSVLQNTTADPYAVAELVEECEEQLTRLPASGIPTGTVPKNDLTVAQLLGFLSDRWLDDHQVNAGCRWVVHEAIQTGVERIQVADASLLQSLAISRLPSRHAEPPRHTRMDTAIRSNDVDFLYIPIFVHGNHWTLFRMDFTSHTFSYADCYSPEAIPPADQLDLIFGWLGSLDARFDTLPSRVPFRPGFRLPKQKDTTSCGIIVMSMLATFLLDHPVWKQDHARLERVRWFTRLAPRIDDEVCLSSRPMYTNANPPLFKDDTHHLTESTGSDTDEDRSMTLDDDPIPSPLTSSLPSSSPSTSNAIQTSSTLGKRSADSFIARQSIKSRIPTTNSLIQRRRRGRSARGVRRVLSSDQNQDLHGTNRRN